MRINTKNSTMVKPMTSETPGGTLWLSNVDLLFPVGFYTQAVYFYRSDGAANFFDTAALKSALSRALVEFYPYAGRLRKNEESDRMEIDCNDEGVLFVEAECDATVDDLGDFAPKPELSLVPAVDYSQGISLFPLLLLQLTRFKCGGVSLGVANEHHLSDGTSALHFINSWSDIALGRPIVPPFFDRTLISARNPPRPNFPHIEYQPPPPPPPKTPTNDDSETTFSIFKLTCDHLNVLKANATKEINASNHSTYEVVAGHVWRCVCMARGLPPDQETALRVPVDARGRLRPPLPSGYFGNAIFIAAPIALCGDLVSNPMKYAVGKVHEAIARLDDGYIRSGVDYLEVHGGRGITYGSHHTKCPNMGITSWVRLPLYDADFGWGKPVYCGPGAAPAEGRSYLLRSPENDGSLLYGVTLLKQHMEMFQKLIYQPTSSC